MSLKDHIAAPEHLAGNRNAGNIESAAESSADAHIRALQIGRLDDGQSVERWGSRDELGILRQLGLDSVVG